MTLRELLAKSLSAKISCAVTGDVVRQLTLSGPHVHLRAGDGTQVLIDADETLHYEPWFMDRGSVLVTSCNHGLIKLCTEFDLVTLDDGTSVSLTWDDGSVCLQRSAS